MISTWHERDIRTGYRLALALLHQSDIRVLISPEKSVNTGQAIALFQPLGHCLLLKSALAVRGITRFTGQSKRRILWLAYRHEIGPRSPGSGILFVSFFSVLQGNILH